MSEVSRKGDYTIRRVLSVSTMYPSEVFTFLRNLKRTPRGTVVELYGPSGCGKTHILRTLYDAGEAFVPYILYTGSYDARSVVTYDGSSRFVAFDNIEYLIKTNGRLYKGLVRAVTEAIRRGAIVLLTTTGDSPIVNTEDLNASNDDTTPQLLTIKVSGGQ